MSGALSSTVTMRCKWLLALVGRRRYALFSCPARAAYECMMMTGRVEYIRTAVLVWRRRCGLVPNYLICTLVSVSTLTSTCACVCVCVSRRVVWRLSTDELCLPLSCTTCHYQTSLIPATSSPTTTFALWVSLSLDRIAGNTARCGLCLL